jgi:hypothetical protein
MLLEYPEHPAPAHFMIIGYQDSQHRSTKAFCTLRMGISMPLPSFLVGDHLSRPTE